VKVFRAGQDPHRVVVPIIIIIIIIIIMFKEHDATKIQGPIGIRNCDFSVQSALNLRTFAQI
jgi:hypothetical protein